MALRVSNNNNNDDDNNKAVKLQPENKLLKAVKGTMVLHVSGGTPTASVPHPSRGASLQFPAVFAAAIAYGSVSSLVSSLVSLELILFGDRPGRNITSILFLWSTQVLRLGFKRIRNTERQVYCTLKVQCSALVDQAAQKNGRGHPHSRLDKHNPHSLKFSMLFTCYLLQIMMGVHFSVQKQFLRAVFSCMVWSR
ncbi:uncharacterized protein [Anabrus simplex]|uniref:uncharacterized protein n=1 Tax=Anabrus simplex TaxID=316456 RepID=UPI0035A2D110